MFIIPVTRNWYSSLIRSCYLSCSIGSRRHHKHIRMKWYIVANQWFCVLLLVVVVVMMAQNTFSSIKNAQNMMSSAGYCRENYTMYVMTELKHTMHITQKLTIFPWHHIDKLSQYRKLSRYVTLPHILLTTTIIIHYSSFLLGLVHTLNDDQEQCRYLAVFSTTEEFTTLHIIIRSM